MLATVVENEKPALYNSINSEPDEEADEEASGQSPVSRRESRRAHLCTALWFFLFGTSGWFSSNVFFAEQPVFVDKTPEQHQFSNLLSVATQIGNVFPIAYKIAKHCFRVGQSRKSLPFTIIVMLGLAIG